MPTRAWSSGPLTHWDTLRVQTGDPSLPVTLSGAARFVELYHWRRGKASPNVWVIDSATGRSAPQAEDVDWARFPMAEAELELMRRDMRIAQHRIYRTALV
jgi:hypothetical protein